MRKADLEPLIKEVIEKQMSASDVHIEHLIFKHTRDLNEYFPVGKWREEGWTSGDAYIKQIVGSFLNSEIPNLIN